MQDIEFTIENGRLWMLQTRTGKRNGPAVVRMALEMCRQGLIDERTAVMRVAPEQVEELLHPVLDPAAEKSAAVIASGLPAGPGGAVGQIVFTAHDAVEWEKKDKKVILVREETNPEDVEGMRAAVAILTARGGMTSHAALVARGWGKCCIVGAGTIEVDAAKKLMHVDGKTYREGDVVTLNGTKGIVYEGALPLIVGSEENPHFRAFMKLCDAIRSLGVRTNADSPEDVARALDFGAEGVGLFRTEHMFYGKGAEEPLFKLRKMIISKDEKERRAALKKLYPHVKADIKKTLKAMKGLPVTIRLLDPPLHEFVPKGEKEVARLAKSLGISAAEFHKRADGLRESNPMMGHRGVRLGITYPEVSEMQIRAVLEATAEIVKAGGKASPELMIPVLCDAGEFKVQKEIVDRVYAETKAKYGLRKIPLLVGTMIEIPRACLLADRIASEAEFFSFGTNDLTQMTFGFSRDDIGGFMAEYLERGILEEDPFQVVDIDGMGQLMDMAIRKGRGARPDLKVGICGEHGGEPESVAFCHHVGMDYVSCSPFRVPIARLAAAQAEITEPRKPAKKKSARKKAAKKKGRK